MIPELPWYPLETKRLVLRPLRETDFDDIHAYAEDPEVARFMDWGPNTPEITREVLGRLIAEQATWPRPGVTLAIEHRADARVIGTIRLSIIDEANRTADFGYAIHRAHWRQGYVSEATAALIAIAFDVLGADRIVAECDQRNVGSYGVMEKLGLRREGAFQASKLVKGQWTDRYLYALLAEEYRARAQKE